MKVAVIDIGGTCIKSGIWEHGKLLERTEQDTEALKGGMHVLKRVIKILDSHADYQAIGVSTTGQVDSDEGCIRYANENMPGYTGIKMKALLEKRFGVPTAVENDVNCAAVGEAHYGAGIGYPDFLCLTYGTGVGGAIVTNGKVYHGSAYSAGEFGAIVTHPEDRDAMRDPFSGCYEKYASVTSLVGAVQRSFPELKNGREILERRYDSQIRAILEQWIVEIGYGLTTLIHIFNPSLIVMGGGIMETPDVLCGVRERMKSEIMSSFRNVEIVSARLGNDAGMLGAGKLAFDLYRKTV